MYENREVGILDASNRFEKWAQEFVGKILMNFRISACHLCQPIISKDDGLKTVSLKEILIIVLQWYHEVIKHIMKHSMKRWRNHAPMLCAETGNGRRETS